MADYAKFWIARELADLGFALGILTIMGLLFAGALLAERISAARRRGKR